MFSTQGNYFAIDVAQFDAQLNLLSETTYPIFIAVAIAIADLNGDGIPDILIGKDSTIQQSLEVLLGEGDVDFQPPVDYSIASPPAYTRAFNRSSSEI